jgi:hypothetical protein
VELWVTGVQREHGPGQVALRVVKGLWTTCQLTATIKLTSTQFFYLAAGIMILKTSHASFILWSGTTQTIRQ